MKRSMTDPTGQQIRAPDRPDGQPNYETTFDVDGQIETSVSTSNLARVDNMSDISSIRGIAKIEILPATLEFREAAEHEVVDHIARADGAPLRFKLAPTYALYMAVRYRASRQYRPDSAPAERAHRLTAFANKIAHVVGETVE
ncbi:PREDICTED: afadin-like, partial [Priapulus caudatus]